MSKPSKNKLSKRAQDNNQGHKKLAVIRSDDIRGCPFGLPVNTACKNVGKSIARMAPLQSAENDHEKAQLTKANKLVYITHKTGKKCPFADKILENHDKVDCDFGDTGQGEKALPWRGSPLYPQTFSGIGLDGLYGYPLGFYADNNESRNLFFGLFSFLGKNQNINQLVKLANESDDKTAAMLDEILHDIQNSDEEELGNKLAQLENMLDEYKDKYNENRMDSGLLWELAEKWFGSRQVNR